MDNASVLESVVDLLDVFWEHPKRCAAKERDSSMNGNRALPVVLLVGKIQDGALLKEFVAAKVKNKIYRESIVFLRFDN